MIPLLKWAGGKSKLAPTIGELLGERCDGVYHEPFLGSGSVFLRLKADGKIQRAVLGDINQRLVAFHTAIRDVPGEVIRWLGTLDFGDEWRSLYNDVRVVFNSLPPDSPSSLQAARFLWLNRACFNGLYRENKAGQFNVPVGRYDKLAMPSADHIRAVSALLQGVDIRCQSFEDAMESVAVGDWLYADPPYIPMSETSNFTAYSSGGFGAHEHKALADSAINAANRGARVVVSNSDTLDTRMLYNRARGFNWKGLKVGRSIGVGKRGMVSELLIHIGKAGVVNMTKQKWCVWLKRRGERAFSLRMGHYGSEEAAKDAITNLRKSPPHKDTKFKAVMKGVDPNKKASP
jgi:DNA adenine methylase